MAKASVVFFCQECGTSHAKWSGKCEGCGSWNSLVEEKVSKSAKKSPKQSLTLTALADAPLAKEAGRIQTRYDEFNRVCGGGIVDGAAMLLGGDPGIGKSTLLLQVMADLSQQVNCAYFTGEESLSQVQLRAKRLGVEHAPLQVAASNNLQTIMQTLQANRAIKVVVIDSIQTLVSDELDSAPGTVSQVKQCSNELIQLAKSQNVVIIFVGHVTKDGTIAGPRVLEHMVDTVLHFEGEQHYDFRILRSIKNRFGASHEMGVFRMQGEGLVEVKNPSELFLSDRADAVSGTAIFAGIEGTRPLLCEIQALVAPSYLPAPRRTTVGWDNNRLAMILAVLESRFGHHFSKKDVYLNVAGGLKLNEPAADLAVAAALISANKNTPLPSRAVYFGEISLSGEVRPVFHEDMRIKEAERLGFETFYCASRGKKKHSGITMPNLHKLV